MIEPDPTARESTSGIKSSGVFTQAAMESFNKNTTACELVRCYRAYVHIISTRLEGANEGSVLPQAIRPDWIADRQVNDHV